MAAKQYQRAQTAYKCGQGQTADGDALECSGFGSKILPPSTTWLNDRLEDGRKAKRALRRRIKPKRQRCSDRISGPGPLFGLSRGVPELPHGGDGLAAISLRPSLVDRNLNPFRAGVVVGPRRPATASNPSRSTGLRKGSGHCSRSRSFSAPPIAPGSRETIRLEDESLASTSNIKSSDSVDVSLHKYYAAMDSQEHISDEEPVSRTPRPPSGEKRGGYSQVDAIRRAIRSTKDTTDAGSKEPHFGYRDCCTAVKDEIHERETSRMTSTEELIDVHSQLLEHPRTHEEDRVVEGSSLEKERAAKVVLSSTVLFSPRGRPKTSRLTYRPQPMGWNAEEAPVEKTPTDRTSPPGGPFERYIGRNLRHDGPVAALSPSGAEPLVTVDGDDIERLVTSEEYVGLVARLWRSDSILRMSGAGAGAGAIAVGGMESMIFGTDESAGDREIAFFVAAASAAPVGMAAAKATSSTVMQHETARKSEAKTPTTAPTKGVTLRAIPLHVGDSSRRYNPYHLRVVRREVDGDPESLGTFENYDSDRDGSVRARDEAGGAHNRFGGTYPEDSVESLDNKGNQARGFEVGDSAMAGYDQGKTGVEVAAFRDSGVVYIDVHEETSFQSLEDWRREKDRYGRISQMGFCRSYPVWKYFRAFKKFVRTRWLNKLRKQLEKELVVLDPVCSTAMAEVISQLQRLSSLQFVTAKKGVTALYTLGEFFDEQIRNTVGCSRLVIEVYDTCGQILGRMAKRHLGAKGLLVVNEAWSQVSPNRDVGSLDNDASSVYEHQSLEEVLMAKPMLGSEVVSPKHSGYTSIAPTQAVDAKLSSTSWSLVARKRTECRRIARAFRWARQRMRQKLRGIVLEHNEQMLASVSRVVPTVTAIDCEGGNVQALNRERASMRRNEGVSLEQEKESRSQQWNSIGKISNISRWRYEARPRPVEESRMALPIDEESLGQASSLALEASLIERAGVDEEDVREWREAFRRRVNMVGGIRRPKGFFVRSRFRSRMSLPDSCLSVPQAIHLACELVPHAVEILANVNPLGAKSALTDMFQSELTPNLCGEGFFPVTHRFQGEHQGMAEDTFVLAMIRLSAQCLGGIDAQLSNVFLDDASSDQGAGNIDTVEGSISGEDEGHQGKPARPATGRVLRDNTGDGPPASVVDVRVWEESAAADTSLLKNATATAKPAETTPDNIISETRGTLVEARRSEARRTETVTRGDKGSTILGGKSMYPCSCIAFEVVLEGHFDERDIQVAPSLQEFVGIARFIQLGVLSILAGLPCLLEHPEVEPFIRMSEDPGLSLDLSGGREYAGKTFPEMGGSGTAKEGNMAFDVAVKIAENASSRGVESVTAETEKVQEQILAGSDWLENLAEDPYFKAVQDQVIMSLASSHNAVYRMVDDFQPLLDEFEELGKFAAERDARKLCFQSSADPEEFAEELVATGRRHGGAKLDLSRAFLATENVQWLRGWYSRLDGYRRQVLSKTTTCPQVLLSVNATSLVTYLTALPDACLREIRQMGPVFLLDVALRLGAVLCRCNAVLCGGLGGVDAMGEKVHIFDLTFRPALSQAVFVGAIGDWLGRLVDEVNHVDNLAVFLEESGCFDSDPHPATASAPSRHESPSTSPASSSPLRDENTSFPLEQVRGQACHVDKRGAAGYFPGGNNPSTMEGITSQGAGDSASYGEDRMDHGWSLREIARPQVQEAVERLRFHLFTLQRAVDQAQVNLRVASREFASLLTKELSSLGEDIARLETDVTAPDFADAATDPTKACAQLGTFQSRLIELQDKEKRYRRYNVLFNGDLCDVVVTKGGARRRQDDEKPRLDLERVASQRKKLVLTWEAQRNALGVRRKWEGSTLIACDLTEMARRHAQAVRAHAIAVNATGSMDSVATSCRTTLEYLGKIVDAVASLWNRNLTSAYWERIERCMPLGEDLKEAGRSKYMAELRSAAGIEPFIPPAGACSMGSGGEGKSEKLVLPPSSPSEVAAVTANYEGVQVKENTRSEMPSGGRDGHTAGFVGGRLLEGQNHTHGRVPAVDDNGGETATETKAHSTEQSSCASEKNVSHEIGDNTANASVSGVRAGATSTDEGLNQEEKTSSLSKISSDVVNALASGRSEAGAKGKGVGEEYAKRGKAAGMMNSVGRPRRKRARQRDEIYGAFPMAAEWGGLTLAALLKHGLLEKKGKICAISAEATASAVLRKTLVELEDMWEAMPMLFAWHFNEGPPVPGQIKQPPNLGDEALNRRQLYAKVLAEPALASSGYSAGPVGGGATGAEDRDPTSEGFTSLLSNGDELLRLSEHCRVVVGNVLDAPHPLLSSGGVGKDARDWQEKISWFQELITYWMASQEQWVRLAPAFIPEDLAGSVPTHDRARFTEISGVFQGILGTLRAEKYLKTLAASQGAEKGGRGLIAKVCKLGDDLEGVSHTMNRWLSSCTAACPRLLALPRHQIFRLFRDWATGRVGSGSAAGETNERIACMFRGVGEILWEKIMTTNGSNVRTRMVTAGVRSSGAGHETVIFSNPVPPIGRFEHWVREIDRQLISAVACDVEVVLNALRKHGNVGPESHPLLQVEVEGEAICDHIADEGDGRGAPANEKKGASTSGSRTTLQGSLLARGSHWTAAVEAALAGPILRSQASAEGSREAMPKNSKDELGILHASLLRYVDSWVRELHEPGTGAYGSIVNAALITQALHQRDVVDGLLEALYPPPQLGKGSVAEGSSPSISTPSLRGGGHGGGDAKICPKAGPFPFVWSCHLRHYSASRAEALAQQGSYLRKEGDADEGSEGDESAIAAARPPLMRIGVGPWNVPYGFEYAGTMERLWLTPLSERCLLHAVHSAKGRLGGLLVPASGSSRSSQHCGSHHALGASSLSEGNDAFGISTAAQDLSVAFGRAFRVLHCSCVTSPQAVGNVITSTLSAGAVSLFAGVDALPKISLAVLAESLRAVMLCLHAGQECVLVNGEEVPLTTKPYQLPDCNPLLHQWRLLPWGEAPGSGGGPFLGIFASLASHGPDPALPLSLRASFRPVLVAPPNPPLLFEAMLFTSGFLGARVLVRGVIQGLHDLGRRALLRQSQGPVGSTHAMSAAHAGNHDKETFDSVDATTILHRITLRAVRSATELLVPEIARELRAARRKLGLASLTTSERKAKTDILSRAVEARVLIAGIVRALLREEIASEAKRSLASDGASDLSQQVLSVGSNLDAAVGASRAASVQRSATRPPSTGRDDRAQETSARRAVMVSTLEESAHLREILKPLVELESAGRKLAQRNTKARANELAEASTANRSRDVAEFRAMLKRALVVNGMSPTKDQISAAVEVWDALWSCRTPAVIVTGAAGVGKSAIFQAMPKMADYVSMVHRKLNKSLRMIASTKGKQQTTASRGRGGVPGEKAEAKDLNSVTVDPPGAVFEPPANARGAAPYRRIVNRQVNFVQYVSMAATFRKKARTAGGDGGTVASGASGSTKGTKATIVSELSNISGGSSHGGASVFSQRSAGTKSTTATDWSNVGSRAKLSTSAFPPGTLDGSAFVIPAQEVEVLYTGGCSAEYLIGSTDEKGSWLDGHLLRRLRVLVEGARGTATRAGTGRHRACGVGTGDVCPRPSGSATSGFSHGCKSRLLVLDGPVSKLLEGILAGDPASGSSLTGLEEHGHRSRCLLLPDGEALALDAWGHVAVETGDVRHLSPSTLTVVTVVHLRSDGRALIKGLLEAWCKKQSRRKFQQPDATGSLNPVVVKTLTEFFNQEGFIQGACCLVATGDNTRAVASMDASSSPSIAASRMRNTLLLLEGLLDQLIEVDDNSVMWEQEKKTAATEKKLVADSSISTSRTAWTRAGKKAWALKAASTSVALSRLRVKSKGKPGAPASNNVEIQAKVVSGASSIESTIASAQETTGETLEDPPARKAEKTFVEALEITRRLRLRTFLLCVYASLWGMGGHLVGDACQRVCSEYIRQFAPQDLRQHIREQNLFGCAVDIRQSKLISIGNDASTCPNALPRGMWTADPYWAMQASELSTPLPPSLVIPSPRVSSVATAAYMLLRLHGARVLVEGPSGAGKTSLLSHLLRAMGKGVPHIKTEDAYKDSDTTEQRGGGRASLTLGEGRAKGGAVRVCQVGHNQGHTASAKGGSELNPLALGEMGADARRSEEVEEDGGDETEIGARIRILGYARRLMADAGSADTVASPEADLTLESPRSPRRSISIANKRQDEPLPSMLRSHRRAFPWSTVYLSMRRRGATDDVARVVGGALRREKDGVLEGPLASGVVIFLDDVHLTQEMAGDGHGDDPCKANCCTAEALREMIDNYTVVGEIRANINTSRAADLNASGESVSTSEVGLTRLGQVPPDFIPPTPAGPGGDSYSRPSSASILAARTTFPMAASISPFSSTSIALQTTREMSVGGRGSERLSTIPRNFHSQQQQSISHPSIASANARLWRRFFILALDAPSTAEVRTIFARTCSDVFSGDGPVSSALGGPRSDTVLLSSEAWTAVYALGGIATEFLHRLQLRLRGIYTERGTGCYSSVGVHSSRTNWRDCEGAGPAGALAAVRLDFFVLGRLLRPLVIARRGDVSTPATVLRLWCHELMREIVEPLPGRWQRGLATSELAKLIRERASHVGVSADEERYLVTCLLEGESPSIWTNTRGLVMAIAYGEQQAAKAMRTKKGSVSNTLESSRSARETPCTTHMNDGVTYREVCTMGDGGTARVMVAHGVLLKTEEVFSPDAMAAHLTGAVDILGVPWPARLDSHPIITPEDVTNVCKCLRHLSLPRNPVVVLRTNCRGMSREGGPVSAFGLACALERARLVVMDGGAGRMCAKIERAQGATHTPASSSFDFRAVFRDAVLSCLGRGARGPYLEGGGVGEGLRLNRGDAHRAVTRGTKPDPTARTPGEPRGVTHGPNYAEGQLLATKTVLLVQGAASVWDAGTGDWALRALMDLVDGGEVRRLFSNFELLELAAEEEQHDPRRQNRYVREGGTIVRGGSIYGFRGGVNSTDSERGDTEGSHETPRWSCSTRGGADFIYRRIVHRVRRSLTVALCLTDDEVEALSPSFPILSTCSCMRLETCSARSMRTEAARSLKTHRPSWTYKAASTLTPVVGPGSSGVRAAEDASRGSVRLWSGSTHVNLVGLLAFERFQSTVSAAKDVAPLGPGANAFEQDAVVALEDAHRLFDDWMVTVEPACVQVFCAVEACVGIGRDGERAGGVEDSPSDKRWESLKARCFHAVAEEGRGPRRASLGEVLLLFKHICRLGCRRIVRRVQTLRRALRAAENWGVVESRRIAEKLELKQRRQDTVQALADNNEQMRRLQEEKLRAQTYWNEQSNKPREQREAQGIRMQQVQTVLQRLKAANEASKEALTTLEDDEMEFLCTLCLGPIGASTPGETSENVAAAARQRKSGLHPELPFVVETVAVMLGNMSDYPRWIGEWIRLKASPSVKIVRSLLLDPSIGERLASFDPESQAGKKTVKIVLDKMAQRQAENTASARGADDKSCKLVSSNTENSGFGGMELDNPTAVFAKSMPVMPLKLESRACGLLAAWVRDTVIAVEAMQRAGEIREAIHEEARTTRQEEERVRAGNLDEVKPLDEELSLRATHKSRLSTRLGHIHHRQSMMNEIGIMRGTVEDSLEVCRQELEDLAEVTRLFAGDALCFATLTCLAAHLPYNLRSVALNRAREAARKMRVPASDYENEPDGTETSVRRPGSGSTRSGGTMPQTLDLKRYRLGHYASGVLTNAMQLQGWAQPLSSAVENGEDSENDAEGRGTSGDTRGKNTSPLPFHPAFMDAAMLTLSTPKWPLILDPEGVALKWLRLLYPDQASLSAVMPASIVNMEVISACAAKGELLPVCFTEGGVHVDLALFLGSDVLRCKDAPSSEENVEVDGYVAVGHGPDAITIGLKPGFRIILFTTSLEFSSLRMVSPSLSVGPRSRGTSSTNNSDLVFLEDSPSALAGIQLIRFGGVDRLGIEADPEDDTLAMEEEDSELRSERQDSSPTSEALVDDGTPVPSLVLAGMGLHHRPGLETLKTLTSRMCEEITGAFPLAMKRSEVDEAMAAVVTARKESLVFSQQLSADHEAIIALLSDRPPCFDLATPSSTSDMDVFLGGEPRTGISDDVEGDQNRILNNLIETVFSYQNTLNKGLNTVPACDRAAQEAKAEAAQTVERAARRLARSGLRFLSRASDILHASGLDPMLYSPTFPGVVRVISASLSSASIDASSGQGKDKERIVLGALSQGLVSRVPHDSVWTLPLAALAAKTHDYFPAPGWWDACMILLADRHGLGSRTPNQVTLKKVIDLLSERPDAQLKMKVSDEREVKPEVGDMTRGPEQVQAVIGPWLLKHETVTPESCGKVSQDDVVSNYDSDADGNNNNHKRTALSPQRWDLGFDTSEWTGHRDASVMGAHDIISGEKNAEIGSFCERFSRRWAAVIVDRSKLNPVQAVAAEPFCGDDVLRRLVLLEVTMKDLFALLSRHVMSKARRWSQWIAEIGQCLNSARKNYGCTGGDLVEHLRFLLAHPPPLFRSNTAPEEWQALDRSASSSSCSIGSSHSESTSNGEASDDNAEQDRPYPTSASCKPRAGPRKINGTGTGNASQLSPGAANDGRTPSESEALCGGPRVRRDSRERIKLKLGSIDETEEKIMREQNKIQASTEARKEFADKASALFGVYSKRKTAGIGEVSDQNVAQRKAREKGERPGPRAATTHPSPMVSNDREDNVDDGDDYVTFVAENFRPRRDDSDWYREEKSTPPLPPTVRKKTLDILRVSTDDGPFSGLAKAVIDPKGKTKAIPVPSDGRTAGATKGKTRNPKHRKGKRRKGRKGFDDEVKSALGLSKRVSEPISQSLSLQARVPSQKKGARRKALKPRDRVGYADGRVGVIGTTSSIIALMHIFKQRSTTNVLGITEGELGSWSQRWNNSQLIGLVLLLALAPDGHLASKCAAMCLVSGSKDDLDRSSLWREMNEGCVLADSRRGGLHSALANFRRDIPTVIMAPRNGDLSDTLSRHFMSILSHIERIAGVSGARVTYHDASIPVHVRLARGVLVAQTRKTKTGQGKTRGNQGVVEAGGEPAKMNMSQPVWEACLKAASEGGWVVIADFEGIADHVSLILDGLCSQSAVRSAATGAAGAATEEKGKDQRRFAIINEVAVRSHGQQTSAVGGSDLNQGRSATTLALTHGGGVLVASPARILSGQKREKTATPARGGPTKGPGTRSSTFGRTSTFPFPPDNPLFKNLSGEGGAISARSQGVLVAAKRPFPVPHKNFRVIFLSTSPVDGARDDYRSLVTGEGTIFWWRPTPAIPTSGHGTSELTVRTLPSVEEDCRVEIVQEFRTRYAVGVRALTEKEPALDMISRGLASFIERKGRGDQVPDDGAAINMHLAANLAFEQVSTTPTTKRRCVGAGRTSPSRADAADGCENSHIPDPAFPEPDTPRSDAASSTTPSAREEVFARIVHGAIHESVTATEISNAPIVDLTAGLLDTEAMQARKEKLASVVNSDTKKSMGSILSKTG